MSTSKKQLQLIDPNGMVGVAPALIPIAPLTAAQVSEI